MLKNCQKVIALKVDRTDKINLGDVDLNGGVLNGRMVSCNEYYFCSGWNYLYFVQPCGCKCFTKELINAFFYL